MPLVSWYTAIVILYARTLHNRLWKPILVFIPILQVTEPWKNHIACAKSHRTRKHKSKDLHSDSLFLEPEPLTIVLDYAELSRDSRTESKLQSQTHLTTALSLFLPHSSWYRQTDWVHMLWDTQRDPHPYHTDTSLLHSLTRSDRKRLRVGAHTGVSSKHTHGGTLTTSISCQRADPPYTWLQLECQRTQGRIFCLAPYYVPSARHRAWQTLASDS